MRALLVILMFTLLPLQFSAAAVASCCEHVAATQGAQGGHHQVAHRVAMEETRDSTSSDIGFDLDCGTCHANCAAAVMATAATMADPSGIERVEHTVEGLLPPSHERPYRPQWSTPNTSG
jgi:NADH:ubiquinone oxidoreductase subunit E